MCHETGRRTTRRRPDPAPCDFACDALWENGSHRPVPGDERWDAGPVCWGSQPQRHGQQKSVFSTVRGSVSVRGSRQVLLARCAWPLLGGVSFHEDADALGAGPRPATHLTLVASGEASNRGETRTLRPHPPPLQSGNRARTAPGAEPAQRPL